MIAVRANINWFFGYFFSDKSAILYALAETHNRCVSCLQAFSPDVFHLPLASVLNHAIDAFEHFYKTQPGYRAVFVSPLLTFRRWISSANYEMPYNWSIFCSTAARVWSQRAAS